MGDIQIINTSIDEALNNLEETLESHKASDSVEVQKKTVNTAGMLVKKIQTNMRAFKLEMDDLDETDREYFAEVRDRYTERVEDCKRTLKAIQTNSAHSELMEGASGTAAIDRSKMGNAELADDVATMDQKNAELVDTALALGHDARDVMTNVAVSMEEQTRRLEEIDEEMKRLGDTITRSRTLVTAFAKRIFTDRIIRCFLLLILLAIVAIIIISTVMPDKTNFNVPDEAKPPTEDASKAAGSAAGLAG